MRRKNGVFGILAFIAICLLVGIKSVSHAGGFYGNPYIVLSPDGGAWSVPEELPSPEDAKNRIDPQCWYPMGERYITGISSTLRAPETGEHEYAYLRTGLVPIGEWRIGHRDARCVHPDYPFFHGMYYFNSKCGGSYYSGWNAWCADCGEKVADNFIYMSREKMRSVTQIDLSLDYYYDCPTCGHLEQGCTIRHVCKQVSFNRYRVVYHPNAEDVAGSMPESFHMYNNAGYYEGEPVSYAKNLRRNAFQREGYLFTGWSTTPSGDGIFYEDGQEIFNLTAENYEEGSDGGTIVLYAQWQGILDSLHVRSLPIEVGGVVGDTDYGSVFAGEEGIYYVKADGKTPFLIETGGTLEKQITSRCRVDRAGFAFSLYYFFDGTYWAHLPSGISVDRGEIDLLDCETDFEGKAAFWTDEYGRAVWSEDGSMRIAQGFVLNRAFHNKKMALTPVSGASLGEMVAFSDPEEDAGRKVLLIGDGEAPLVEGLEALDGLPVQNLKEGDGIRLELAARDDLSGVQSFYAVLHNLDNDDARRYDPEEDGRIRIDMSEDESLFSGDLRLTVYARDRVGNEAAVEKDITEFGLSAQIVRILSPHQPVFKRGESGMLKVTVWGYADKLEVLFPEAFTADDPSLNHVFTYPVPREKEEEEIVFMVPLYLVDSKEYSIVVKAYKGERFLEEHPVLCTLKVEDTVLGELRTRLR